jgi:hypothetical protein
VRLDRFEIDTLAGFKFLVERLPDEPISKEPVTQGIGEGVAMELLARVIDDRGGQTTSRCVEFARSLPP